MTFKPFMFIILGAVLILPGCGGGSGKSAGKTAGSDDPAAEASRCQNLLENAITRLEPANLGVSSKSTSATMGLNDWFKRCGSDGWSENWSDDTAGILPEELAGRVASERFSESDSLYIRTCLLLRSYAQSIDARNELDRIMGLFYAVVRDIKLNNNDLPITPFEVLMTGRGTAKERAWVFISTLRQLRIDGFIVVPSGKEADWLVGVAADDGVLLFDMRLGLPIFRVKDHDDDVLPSTAVSMAELAEDDEILGSLGVEGEPYGLTDDDLQHSNVYLVGGPATFAQRSLTLQDVMAGEQIAVLCDPVQDLDGAPGLVSRVKAAGGWEADDVSIWEFPIKQLEEFSHLNEADQGRLNALMSPMKARVEREANEGQLVFTVPHWELYHGRIDQLAGVIGEHVPTRYQRIRLGRLEVISEFELNDGKKITVRSPEEFVVLHNRAAEDAMLWVAVYQYNEGDLASAIDGFYAYRRTYPEGVWKGHVEFVLSLALAKSGKTKKAGEYLAKAIEIGGPQTAGYRLLQSLWGQKTENGDAPQSAGEAKKGADANPANPKPTEGDKKEADRANKADSGGDQKDNESPE